MKITRIEVVTAVRPMAGAQRNARRAWSEKAFLFCFVTGEDGLVGVGEGWTSYASPRALAATVEDDVAPRALGRTLGELLGPEGLNPAIRDACVMSGRYGILAVALSAVEMALHDLAARAEGVPLWRWLGATNPRVPVYASGGLYAPGKTPGDLGREAAGWVAEGHRAVKIKVGGASEAEDLARVAACREAVGPDVALMVDAHYTMDVERAVRFAEGLAAHDVTWLEAPILPDDWRGHDALAVRSPIALCGNETLPWRDGFARLADAGVRYLMPDLSACWRRRRDARCGRHRRRGGGTADAALLLLGGPVPGLAPRRRGPPRDPFGRDAPPPPLVRGPGPLGPRGAGRPADPPRDPGHRRRAGRAAHPLGGATAIIRALSEACRGLLVAEGGHLGFGADACGCEGRDRAAGSRGAMPGAS